MEKNELSYFFHSKTGACVNKHGHVKNKYDSKIQTDDLRFIVQYEISYE